jgi:hypothetical protein
LAGSDLALFPGPANAPAGVAEVVKCHSTPIWCGAKTIDPTQSLNDAAVIPRHINVVLCLS